MHWIKYEISQNVAYMTIGIYKKYLYYWLIGYIDQTVLDTLSQFFGEYFFDIFVYGSDSQIPFICTHDRCRVTKTV